MKRVIFSILLSLVLALSIVSVGKAVEAPVTATIAAHVAGNLGNEIDAYMSDHGISSYNSIEGLIVSGGTINETDRQFLYTGSKLCQILKIVDFSKTSMDYTGNSVDTEAGPNQVCKYAFGNWTALTSIVLPDNVTYIKEWAFSQCTSLEKVYLPSALEGIDSAVFYNCNKLKDVYSSSVVPPTFFHPNAFMYANNNLVFHVPDGAAAAWDVVDYNTNNHTIYGIRIENMPPIINGYAERISAATAQIQIVTEEPGYCYYALVKNNEKAPVIDTSGTGLAVDPFTVLTISLTDLVQGPYDLYIQAKDSIGNMGTAIKVDINAYVPYVDAVISNHETGKLGDEIDRLLGLLDIPGEYEKIQSLKISGGAFDSDDWYAMLAGDHAQLIDLSGVAIEDIPYGAFEDFYITNIVLPSSLKSIGEYAFEDCTNLKSVIIQSAVPPTIYANSFNGVSNELAVYLPPGAMEAYKGAEDGDAGDGLWYGLGVKEYSIVVVQTDGNGTASTDAALGIKGQKVSLSAVPNQGCRFKEWQVIAPAGLSIDGNSFILPDGKITIKAVFEKMPEVVDVPKTGDESTPWILLVLCSTLTALSGLGLLVKRKADKA